MRPSRNELPEREHIAEHVFRDTDPPVWYECPLVERLLNALFGVTDHPRRPLGYVNDDYGSRHFA
jgi:hypothetical protein